MFQKNRVSELLTSLSHHYYNPDLDAIRAVLGAIAAHQLKGQPVWLTLIGPPSSMKTTDLNGLRGREHFHFVDQLSARAFISGQMEDPGKTRTQSPSLLHRIGPSGFIVVPDFSTITAMRAQDREQLLSDMRRIYDGELRKEFGHTDNSADRSWKGRITLLAAGTPEMEQFTGVAQSLGERFLKVRIDRPDMEAAIVAMSQDMTTAEQALKAAYDEILDAAGCTNPVVSNAQRRQLAAMAELVVRGRTHIQRDSRDKSVILVEPAIEGPTRCAQQLVQLACGHAALEGRAELDESDLALAKRVGFDSMINARRKVLDAVIAGRAVTESGVPKSTSSYSASDLEAVGLFEAPTLGRYRLTQLALDLLSTAGITREAEPKAA